MVDVFMSWKRRKSSRSSFAFVRFLKLKDAQAAIKNLHEMNIRGSNITVVMAEYKKSGGDGNGQSKKQGAMIQPGAVGDREAKFNRRSYRDIVSQRGNNGANIR